MKLKARARLVSYRTIKPFHKVTVDEGGGRRFMKSQGAKQIKDAFHNSEFQIYDNSFDGQYELHILKGNDYYGMVFFTGDQRTQSKYPLLKDVSEVYVPHIDFAPGLAGTGIATELYAFAIHRGLTLFTSGHTDNAKKLWDRVSRLPRINNYYIDKTGITKDINAPKTVRVLTTKILG